VWRGNSSDVMTNICASEAICFTRDMNSVGVAILSSSAYQKIRSLQYSANPSYSSFVFRQYCKLYESAGS
jgi:hypothetical protein